MGNNCIKHLKKKKKNWRAKSIFAFVFNHCNEIFNVRPEINVYGDLEALPKGKHKQRNKDFESEI